MSIGKLLTYTFDSNVGPFDRIFRVLSGGIIAALPWTALSVSQPVAIAMTVAGLAWFMTGVVSRCGMYYMLGLSTKKS